MRISDWSSDVCSSDLVDRRILVTRKGSTAFEKGRHAADLNLCAGEFGEEARQTPAHIVELCRDRRDQRRFSRLIVRIDEFGIDEQRHDTGREIVAPIALGFQHRSEEHTSELQSLMRISYAVFCL